MKTILVVEDEPNYVDSYLRIFSKEGYKVIVATNGRQALELFDSAGADLVLLDLMIPEISGTDVCKQIRTKSDVPIIMVTAKDSTIDKVVGLELGADDYITKPADPAELLARIRAVLRRPSRGEVQDENLDNTLKAGNVTIDIDRHLVTINGKQTALPLKEFDLLEYLVRNAGRVLTRAQIIDRVWGSDYFGDTQTLDVHIKRLRAKIEVDPAKPIFILTIRGLGYKFEN